MLYADLEHMCPFQNLSERSVSMDDTKNAGLSDPHIPVVTVAEFACAWLPHTFWEEHCRPLESKQIQFIGLDGDLWPIEDMRVWIKELQSLLGSTEPKRIFLTSIIIMAWPEELNHTNLERLDRFRDALLSGANLRMKREEYYRHDGADFLKCFQKDLHDAGMLLPPDERPTPDPLPEPQFATQEEEENYRQRMEFYGNPPFKWRPDDVAALLRHKKTNA